MQLYTAFLIHYLDKHSMRINQHTSKGNHLSIDSSSAQDQMEDAKFRKATEADEKNGNNIQEYKTKNDEITDDELTDENAHGNTL